MKDYNARNIVKKFMKDNHATMVKVVEKMNRNHPDQEVSAQNLSSKLLRNTIKFSEVMEIADVLGYEICFVKKGTKPYESVQEQKQLPVPAKKSMDLKTESPSALVDRINTKYVIAKGNYFKDILIIGKKCKVAAMDLLEELVKYPSKSKLYGYTFEIMLCRDIEKEYDVIVYPCGYDEDTPL